MSTAMTQDWMQDAATSVLRTDFNDIPSYTFYKNDPNGPSVLHFDESDHVYYRINEDGSRQDIPGVTTILGKAIDKSFALVPWATKLTVTHIREQMVNADGSFKQLSTEEFNSLLDTAKNKHREKLESAGDIGRIAHDFLERIAKDAIANSDGYVVRASILPDMPNGYVQGTDVELELRTSMARKCVLAGLDWIRRHRVQFVHAERKVYSRSHNFAGTVDGVAYMDSCDDLSCCRGASFQRTCVVLDYKSANEIRSSFAFQLVAYQFALIEELELPITHRVVLRLGKEDGKFEPWLISSLFFTDDLKTFLDALSLYNSLENIEKRRSADKKELKAIIKHQKDDLKAAAKEAERLEKLALSDAKKAIKAEEKAERDAAKAEAKLAKAKPVAGPVLVVPSVEEMNTFAGAMAELSAYDQEIGIDAQSEPGEAEPGIAHTVQAACSARFWRVSTTYTNGRIQ
jgi:hypothetical protein